MSNERDDDTVAAQSSGVPWHRPVARAVLMVKPLPRLAVTVTLLSAGSITAAPAARLDVWDPGPAGLSGQFGTTVVTAEDIPRALEPFPDSTLLQAPFNGVPESTGEYFVPGDDASSDARARATTHEVSLGVRTSNLRAATVSGSGLNPGLDIGAGAAASTSYFVPAMVSTEATIPAKLTVEGHFDSTSFLNFVYADVKVDGIPRVSIEVFDEPTSPDAFLAFYDEAGDFDHGSYLGPWPGSVDLPFGIPFAADASTVGRLDVRLWSESDSGGNSLNFLDTAALTIEPLPGTFVGLATGLRFLPDAARSVPEPSSLWLVVVGALGMRLVRGGRGEARV